MSHGHCYAISPVIHNDSFEKLEFNINLHGDYKSYVNFEILKILKFYENFEINFNFRIWKNFENF